MSRERTYYVYLLTNQNHSVLYTGVTNNLLQRVYEHKNHLIKGFTDKYNVTQLVYFEETTDIDEALRREKQIKKWRREKKNNLITGSNPGWEDLSEGWYEIPRPCSE